MQVGDIVHVSKMTGLWTVMAPAGPGRWHVRREAPRACPTGRTVGEADLELVARPAVTIGLELRHDGVQVTVERIEGEKVHVIIPASKRRRQLRDGTFLAFGPGAAEVHLGALVAENIDQLRRTA